MVSCFGPSYELAFEMDAELRRRKMRHKVPIIYLTSEPYLGHMGVGGLGKSKTFMEDEFAERDIKPIINQAIRGSDARRDQAQGRNKDPLQARHDRPAVQGCARRHAPRAIPAGSSRLIKTTGIPKTRISLPSALRWRLRRRKLTPVPTGVPKTGFMTVKMAKTAAATIASDIKGKPPPWLMNSALFASWTWGIRPP